MSITKPVTFLMRCRRCLCEWRAQWAEQRCPKCNCPDVRVEMQR
jgi:hypothetical protein